MVHRKNKPHIIDYNRTAAMMKEAHLMYMHDNNLASLRIGVLRHYGVISGFLLEKSVFDQCDIIFCQNS